MTFRCCEKFIEYLINKSWTLFTYIVGDFKFQCSELKLIWMFYLNDTSIDTINTVLFDCCLLRVFSGKAQTTNLPPYVNPKQLFIDIASQLGLVNFLLQKCLPKKHWYKKLNVERHKSGQIFHNLSYQTETVSKQGADIFIQKMSLWFSGVVCCMALGSIQLSFQSCCLRTFTWNVCTIQS